MASLVELQEKRSKLAAEIREKAKKYTDQGKKWTDDAERSNWDKLNADYDANAKELIAEKDADAISKRAEAVEQEMRSKGDTNPIPGQEDTHLRNTPVGEKNDKPSLETQQMAFRGWIAAKSGYAVRDDLQARFDEAMHLCKIRPYHDGVNLRLAGQSDVENLVRDWKSGPPHNARSRAEEGWDKRAMSGSFFQSGGGLVFPSLIKRLEINMLAFGGMRQAATTIFTQTGEETGMPTADDTTNEGTMIGENQSIGVDTPPTIGQRKWGAWTFTSKPVLVPYSLLQDTSFDLPSMLGDMLGERLGRGTNRKYTVGNGVNGPNGITIAGAQGATSINSGVIGYNDLVKLQHSVDPAYRANASYMCHDTTLLAVRLLTDAQGRPLWTSGTDTNSMDRLNFMPLYINQHMAAGTTTGNISLLFGELNRYYIRRAGVARFYRLQERYRDNDQDGFVMLLREDGNLLNAGTNPVKYLLQS